MDGQNLSMDQIQQLLDAAPDMMVVVDSTGRITASNLAASTSLGYGPEELRGQKVEVLVPEELRHRHLAHRSGYQAAPSRREMGSQLKLQVQRKDGSTIPTEISLSPITTAQGSFTIAALRDVTARRELQRRLEDQADALRRSNAELEQFAYVASHDLQEPLRMVTSFAQLLERRYHDKLDDDGREFIGFMVDGATRMQALINDLLDFSRVESRGSPFEPVDTDALVAEILRDLHTDLEESGSEVRVEPLPEVVGDRRQLRQVIQNLLSNSIKYRGDAPAQVELRGHLEGDRVVLEVADKGIGIDPQHHERIFGLFQRLHGRGRYSGTGIGLAIARKVAERHHGELTVQSEPGEGSTFRLVLPADPPESTP